MSQHDPAFWRSRRRTANKHFIERFLKYTLDYDQPIAAHYDALETEHSTILQAISAAEETGQWKELRQLVWALGRYFDIRGHWREYQLCLKQAIQAAQVEKYQPDEAFFLHLLATLTHKLGDYTKAEQM